MKFAILGDTHWGARKDAPVFYKHYDKFYDHFFEHIQREGITDVFQTGDTFEARQKTSSLTLEKARNTYFCRAENVGITTHITVGNHDIYHRESVALNTPRLLLSDFEYVRVADTPQTLPLDDTPNALGGKSIDLIPWICKENEADIVKFMENSTSQYCVGHFEIAGFQMYRGGKEANGLSMDLFDRYEHVWSGHYHTRSQKANVTYVGTPYELTWQDYNDPKGYHIFDTETGELTFHENPHTSFVVLDYNDKLGIDPIPDITDKFVRIVVTSNTDQLAFDAYKKSVTDQMPYDLKIDEEGFSLSAVNLEEDDVVIENTMVVTEKYIDASDTEVDKPALKAYMHELYVEAINAVA